MPDDQPKRGRPRLYFGQSCLVETCEQPAQVRDLCCSHYNRIRETGCLREDEPIGYRKPSMTKPRSSKPKESTQHRSGRAFRRQRAIVLAGNPQFCYLCNGEKGPIRYDLKRPHPLSPSVDHLVTATEARTRGPEEYKRLMLDPNNMKPAHYGCNSARKDGPIPQPRLQPSRVWFTEGD